MSERSYSVRLSANVDAYVAAMKRAETATGSMSAASSANLKKVGGDMQNVGGQMTRAISLPLAAAGVAAVKMSLDFDATFGKMQGLAGVTADEVDGLKEAVMSLSGQTARSPQELAEALYFLRSSGLEGAEALEALEFSAKASAAGLGSTAVIADAVSSAMNAYAKSGLNAAEATDILVATARAGKAEPDQLAGALGRVLPIAAELGVSFEDVGGAVAAFSLTGNDASGSVTLLSNVLLKLLKPSQQGAEALEKVGMSTDTIRQSIAENGLQATLENLRVTLGDAGFTKFMEDAQAVTGALALTGDNLETTGKAFETVRDNAGLTGEAFDKMAGTDGFKMKQAFAEIQTAMIQAGEIIVPIVAGIAGAIGNLAERFSSLPAPVQQLVVGFLAFAGAAGPLIVIAGTLVKNFMLIRGALIAMSTAAAANPLLVLGAAAVGVAVAVGLMGDETEDTTPKVRSLIEAIKSAGDVGQGFSDWLLTLATDTPALAQSMDAAGVSISELSAAAQAAAQVGKSGGDAWWALRTSITEAGYAAGLSEDQMNGVHDELDSMVVVAYEAARSQEALAAVNDVVTEKMTLMAAAIQGAGAASALAGVGLDELGADLLTAGAAAVASEDAIAAHKREMERNEAASESLSTAIKDAQSDFDALASAADHLVASLERLNGGQQGVEETTRQLYDGMDAFKEKVAAAKEEGDKFATSLDMTSQTGRDNRATVQGLTDDYIAHAAALVADGASMEDAGATVQDLTADMVNQMEAMGFSREEALRYIETLGLTPGTVETAVKLAGDQVVLDQISAIQEDLGVIDDGASAEVEARVKAGELTSALALLRHIASYDGKNIGLVINARQNSLGSTIQSAEGRYVGRPMISTLGEGGLPEVVLPLTKPGRINALMSDPRVSGPILAALGGVQSANGRTVNLTHSTTPAATVTMATPTTVGGSSGGSEDAVMANRYKRGDLSLADYRAYLEGKRAALTLFSSEEQAYYDDLEALRRDEVKTAADVAAEEKRIADQKLSDEDQRMAAMHEMGEISNAQYEEYLSGRQQSYQRYSVGWMAIWSTIQSMHREEEAAARKAMEEQARAADLTIDAAFDAARAREELQNASLANADADAEYNAAAIEAWTSGRDKTKTAEENQSDRERAAGRFSDAAEGLANAAYRLRDAQANAAGFADGTTEWAQSVRSALIGDRDWNAANGRGPLAAALDRKLTGIPSFANGGYMPATPGGAIVRVAEAGQGEFMVPADQMFALANAGGGGTTFVDNRQIHIVGPYDRAGVGRELRAILAEDDRRNGRT